MLRTCQWVPRSTEYPTMLGRLVVAEDGVGALLKGLEPRIARVAIAQVSTNGVLWEYRASTVGVPSEYPVSTE